MKNSRSCTIYIVRHGETEWNKSHVVMGQKDSPLTELGIEQAKTTATKLKDVNFDLIISSDLPRAYKTAEIIKSERPLIVETSELLRERNYGHFQGRPKAEYKEATKLLSEAKKLLSEKEQWKHKVSEDVESDEEIVVRFMAYLKEIAILHPNKVILIVTHAGCIRTFLMRMGCFKYGELKSGNFQNAGHIKTVFNGTNFIVEEIVGVDKNAKGAE